MALTVLICPSLAQVAGRCYSSDGVGGACRLALLLRGTWAVMRLVGAGAADGRRRRARRSEAGGVTGGKRMEDLETNQISSRQEIYPQPQVVCGRESAASQLAPQGAGGAPLTAASQSWQLCCCAMWKEPVPGSHPRQAGVSCRNPHMWHLDIFAL